MAAIKPFLDKCPSGALQYVLADEARMPETDRSSGGATIRVLLNGPLMVEGSFTLLDESGMMLSEHTSLALCRCGASGNAPFCDGSHVKINFNSKKNT